jgi:cyclopropane fatty-acyl-phospholipid synthase-like methyltransferase
LLARATVHDQFPGSSRYDGEWVMANAMGPNPLWLAESLCELMTLEPGMRVLDLGCGKAITSIFLAQEFGVHVVAADLWVQPTENWARIVEAGVEDRVMPLHAEAHDLTFAHGYFDAIVSIDAYHYFGTDDLYLAYVLRFLAGGGQLGIVVPATTSELGGTVPEHLDEQWDWDYHSFHSPAWWELHWAKLGKVQVEHADLLPDGWRHWMHWEEATAAVGPEQWREQSASWARALAGDDGRTLGFARVVARKSQTR